MAMNDWNDVVAVVKKTGDKESDVEAIIKIFELPQSEDSDEGLALLGAEVKLDLECSAVKIAVDATKADLWGKSLQEILAEGRLEKWRAAKLAGRMQFSLSLNFGRVGRAFVRPFHMQAAAPLPGDLLSMQAKRSCLWFARYLELRPVVVASAFKPRREHIVTWSDAAGNRKTAVFLWSKKLGWKWTYWRVPRSIVRRLLSRSDDQIGYLELAAVVVALSTFEDDIKGQAWTAWIDNQGVVGSLIKGGSRALDLNPIIGQMWMWIARSGIALQTGRVASRSNIADEPTRGSDEWVKLVNAQFYKPVIPGWLTDPWLAPDFPPGKFS